MKCIAKIICCSLTMIFFIGCKKTTTGHPLTVQAKCIIKTETTALSGNEKSFEYKFDDKNQLISVKVLNKFGGPIGTYETGYSSVVYNAEYLNKPTRNIIEYENTDFFNNKFPAKAFVSVDDGDTLRVHYYTYFFFYDSKDRLITIGEQTDYVVGDWEYDLHIGYNDQDNVTSLQYEWTTGPNEINPPIIVTAYDNKPTPYAAIKGWPFLLINFAWNNYDPEPIFTALSKNNPLNYTFGSGANLFERKMEYTYNDNGFPTERKNTNKNTNGEYTFLQTFSYDCK